MMGGDAVTTRASPRIATLEAIVAPRGGRAGCMVRSLRALVAATVSSERVGLPCFVSFAVPW